MPLLRRKKKIAGEAPPEAVAAESPDGDGAAVDEQPPAPETAPPPPPAEAAPPEPEAAEGPGYVDEDRLPPSVWVEALLDNRPPPSREELDRRAEADFQAAIAPSLDKLREAVPDASSPEEARRILEEREQQAEYLRDEEADLLKGRDIFTTEASVHYRIQKHLERPRRRPRFGEPWRPPAELARSVRTSSRRSLGPGD